jgi:hypothetical protein
VLGVTVLALVAFGVAIVALGDDARRGCVVDAPFDPSYRARLLTRGGSSEIPMAETEHEIELSRDGSPVTGAKVCARVFMVGMEAMGSSDSAAEETAPGVYRVTILFVMTGGWTGNILIEEPGQAPASVTVDFEVV